MKTVIGIDEVGRGPLAGPVTACAVYLKDEILFKNIIFNQTIRDSKKLKKDTRIKIIKTIRKNSKLKNAIFYSLSSRSAKHIDKYGINNSIKSCIKSCIKNLDKKGVDTKSINIQLDGGLYLEKTFNNQKTYIKGDEKLTSIAIASIIAKVFRDSRMEKLAKKYPAYFWDKNSGYGTKEHLKAIKEIGLTEYHRRSFLKKYI